MGASAMAPLNPKTNEWASAAAASATDTEQVARWASCGTVLPGRNLVAVTWPVVSVQVKKAPLR